MKTIFIILFLGFAAKFAGPCYSELFQEGYAAFNEKKYATAIKKWKGGLLCPDAGVSERALLRQWIELAHEKKKNAGQAPAPTRRNFVEKIETPAGDGQIDWTERYVEAMGMAVIDRNKYALEAQAKAMAIRGAEAVAYANLLEIAQGVRVQRNTTVRDLATESDLVRTEVRGIVRGARQVGEPLEKDGMMHVRVRMPLYDLAPLAAQTPDNVAYHHLQLPRPQATGWLLPPVPGEDRALLLRFDQYFDPALAPIIADDAGKTRFDLSVLIAPAGNAGAPPDWNMPRLEAGAVQRPDGTIQLLNNATEVLEYLERMTKIGYKTQPIVAFLAE